MMFDKAKVLVTGANGFLGRHVVAKLEEYRNSGTDGSRRSMQILTPSRQELDLLDYSSVVEYMAYNEPDVIIHLAGSVGGIGLNKEQPARLTYENLQMGVNLIEVARMNPKLQKFVCIGTTCSYASECPIPFKEEDFIEFNRGGDGMPEITNAGYGLGKRMLYELLRNYQVQYGMPFVYLIPVNMVGEHDHFEETKSHVVPALIKRFDEAQRQGLDQVAIWGTGKPTREFLYAGDAAEAILRATMLYNDDKPMNIGNGVEVPIAELAEKIKDVVGYEGEIVWDDSKPDGQMRRCMDVSFMEKTLGYQCSTTIDEAIEKTYKWYCENLRG
jgi:nucleoside-diphosphate-sugar epimerase